MCLTRSSSSRTRGSAAAARSMIDAFVDGARALGRDAGDCCTSGYVLRHRLAQSVVEWSARARRGKHAARALAVGRSRRLVRLRGARAGTGRTPAGSGRRSTTEWRARTGPARRAHAVIARAPTHRRCAGSSGACSAAPRGSRDERGESRAVSARRRRRRRRRRHPADPDRHRRGSRPEPDEAWRRGSTRRSSASSARGDDPRKNVGCCSTRSRSSAGSCPDARLRARSARPPRRPAGDGVETTGEVADVAPVAARVRALRAALASGGLRHRRGRGARLRRAGRSSRRAAGRRSCSRSSGGGRVIAGFGAASSPRRFSRLLGDPPAAARDAAAGRDYVAAEHSPTRFRERSPPRCASSMTDVTRRDRQLPGCGGAAGLPREPREQTRAAAEEIVVATRARPTGAAALAAARGATLDRRRRTTASARLYNRGVEAATSRVRAAARTTTSRSTSAASSCLAAALDADGSRFAADARQLDWDGRARARPRPDHVAPRHALPRVPARAAPRPRRRRRPESCRRCCANGAAMLVRRSTVPRARRLRRDLLHGVRGPRSLLARVAPRLGKRLCARRARVRHRVGAVTTAGVLPAAARVVAPQPRALRAQVPAGSRKRSWSSPASSCACRDIRGDRSRARAARAGTAADRWLSAARRDRLATCWSGS